MSEDNFVEVTQRLAEVVMQADDQVDQSQNNLEVVAMVLVSVAELLVSSAATINVTVRFAKVLLLVTLQIVST